MENYSFSILNVGISAGGIFINFGQSQTGDGQIAGMMLLRMFLTVLSSRAFPDRGAYYEYDSIQMPS